MIHAAPTLTSVLRHRALLATHVQMAWMDIRVPTWTNVHPGPASTAAHASTRCSRTRARVLVASREASAKRTSMTVRHLLVPMLVSAPMVLRRTCATAAAPSLWVSIATRKATIVHRHHVPMQAHVPLLVPRLRAFVQVATRV